MKKNTGSRRQARVADQIQVEIADMLLKELRDPRLGFISITRVKMSPDLKYANVYFTVLGDEQERAESLEGLERARGFIRREIGDRLKLRYAPDIRFFYDDTLEYAEHIQEVIKKIHEREQS